MLVLKVSGRVLGKQHPRGFVIDKKLTLVLEPCLLAYGIEVVYAETEIDGFKGYLAKGKKDRIAKALRRCIAYTLGRKAVLEEQKILLVELKQVRQKEKDKQKQEDEDLVTFEEL